jgi:hypothetical protein
MKQLYLSCPSLYDPSAQSVVDAGLSFLTYAQRHISQRFTGEYEIAADIELCKKHSPD